MNTEAEREDALTLEILDAVHRDERVSQRHLAQHLGVALGLANSYLKRCVKKGWVKVQQAPANRYLYYLTPKGFAEKSRLTASYLQSSLAFYREASDSCAKLINECERNGWRRILLCGVSDVAEIAVLRSLGRQVEVVGLYDPENSLQQFIGYPVWRELAKCPPHDVRFLTHLTNFTTWFNELGQLADATPLLVPSVMRLELNTSK